LVDTVKVALELPAATVTLVGTVATAMLLLASATTTPPADAIALRVTVPLEVLPAATLAGVRSTEESVGAGIRVRLEDWVTPPDVAEIATAVDTATE